MSGQDGRELIKYAEERMYVERIILCHHPRKEEK